MADVPHSLRIALVVLCGFGAVLCTDTASSVQSHRSKRDLPLSLECDPRVASGASRCFKGDLLSQSVGDCKKTGSRVWSCSPKGGRWFSTSTDVADTSKHGVNCVPDTSKPVTCGTKDTRCVCDSPVDITSPLKRPYKFNNCRCQYWPAVDVRDSRPNVCRQYDHGGTSSVHFYACCNNCASSESTCDGQTYQGGGSEGQYCAPCGKRVAEEMTSRHTYTFNCGGCKQQGVCKQQCDEEYPIASKLPGLCPMWAGCFRRCCLQAVPQQTNSRRSAALAKFRFLLRAYLQG
eukprot:scpid85323/ scgid12610/ 